MLPPYSIKKEVLLMKLKQVNKNNDLKAYALNHIEDEYNAYVERLKQKNVDTIIESAYETTIKKEIYYMLEGKILTMDDDKINAMIKTKYPIDYIYQEWLSMDGGINEVLEYPMLKSFDNWLDSSEIETDDEMEL